MADMSQAAISRLQSVGWQNSLLVEADLGVECSRCCSLTHAHRSSARVSSHLPSSGSFFWSVMYPEAPDATGQETPWCFQLCLSAGRSPRSTCRQLLCTLQVAQCPISWHGLPWARSSSPDGEVCRSGMPIQARQVEIFMSSRRTTVSATLPVQLSASIEGGRPPYGDGRQHSAVIVQCKQSAETQTSGGLDLCARRLGAHHIPLLAASCAR